MSGQRIGEGGLSGPSPSLHHINFAYAGLNSPPTSGFINQENSTFDFGELVEAIDLQGVKINNINDETKPSVLYKSTGGETLEMFPSWQSITTRVDHIPTPRTRVKSSNLGGEDEEMNSNSWSTYKLNTISSSRSFEAVQAAAESHPQHQEMASRSTRLSHTHQTSSKHKVVDSKTLRRLAQNREAAKKSRLRKKAYVQQLESSRIRLSQLEQVVIQGSSSVQGFLMGSGGNISSGGAVFDMEYARWLEDDDRHMRELRSALQAHLSDSDLRIIVESCVGHYDEIFELKAVAAKSDIFHLLTGIWTTPAERCFLWIAGFRPSDLIKMLIRQVYPLSEAQVLGIYSLQHSSQQAEEALSQGLEQLQQSLINTLINNGMHHMAIAIGKLANMEGFVRQADNLRQQTLHQLCQILTVRQAARCFLVIGEYYCRLRSLSSLWASRPRIAAIAIDKEGKIAHKIASRCIVRSPIEGECWAVLLAMRRATYCNLWSVSFYSDNLELVQGIANCTGLQWQIYPFIAEMKTWLTKFPIWKVNFVNRRFNNVTDLTAKSSRRNIDTSKWKNGSLNDFYVFLKSLYKRS